MTDDVVDDDELGSLESALIALEAAEELLAEVAGTDTVYDGADGVLVLLRDETWEHLQTYRTEG